MNRKMFQIILVTLPLLAAAGTALADCPDVVSCKAYVQVTGSFGTQNFEEVGKIHVPTCYKFGNGCRPWHCDDAPDTDRAYWTNQCVQRVPQCTVEAQCEARFPGAFVN